MMSPFLIAAGLIGATLGFGSTPACAGPATKENSVTAYIGGYTSGRNRGIYRITLDTTTGQLSEPTLAAEAKDASFLIEHPTLPIVYAACEGSKPIGVIRAFKITADETLVPIGERQSKGDGPCYVGVDEKARWLFTANYGDGVVAALPIDSDGGLNDATFVEQHQGRSAIENGQAGPHAHSFVALPNSSFALSADLGTDEVSVYRLADKTIERIAAAKLPPGSGPRHIAFSADGKFVYVCNELSNTLATFGFDPARGSLQQLDLRSTLPADFKGDSACAEIATHPSGKWLYVSNRGHDSLSVFEIDPHNGLAKLTANVPTGGHWPRHFAVEPDGRFLVVANQRSDSLVSFRIDPNTGIPAATGSTVIVASPACVRFVR